MTASEYAVAWKRLEVLSQIPSQIVGVLDERELRDRLGESLAKLFDGLLRFELFVTETTSATLIPTGDLRRGLSFLSSLTARLESLSPSDRLQLGASGVIPFLKRSGMLSSTDRHGAMMAAPLLSAAGRSAVGFILVEADRRSPDFIGADVDALAAIAAQFSMALQRLRAEARGATHTRIQRDLELASEIQRFFLPAPPPAESGFKVVAEYSPAYDVGGDFYDLVPGARGEMTVVIGDVSGKGMPAALLMSRISSEFRRIAETSSSPREILAELNRSMMQRPVGDSFVTAACLRLSARHGTLTVANAGHMLPIVRRANGSVIAFGQPSGTPLGMLAAERYEDDEIAMKRGDMVFLMTDGLAEALDSQDDRLGTRHLLHIIKQGPHDLSVISDRILEAADQGRADRAGDDVTLVAIGYEL